MGLPQAQTANVGLPSSVTAHYNPRTMTSFPKHPRLINTLHLTEEQRKELLARLDSVGATPGGADQRLNNRVPAPEQAVLLWRIEPTTNREPSVFQAKCRNISDTGISFLHGSYVYPDTPCAFILGAPGHPGLRIDVTIVHCRYVEDGVYEVGARFNKPIDLSALGI